MHQEQSILKGKIKVVLYKVRIQEKKMFCCRKVQIEYKELEALSCLQVSLEIYSQFRKSALVGRQGGHLSFS